MFLFRNYTFKNNIEIRYSIKKIYSISWYKINLITSLLGLSFPYYINNLNYYNINLIIFLLKGLILSDTRIKRNIDFNINHLIIINCYKGLRHKFNLPTRGQRTRTNANTQRNKKNF